LLRSGPKLNTKPLKANTQKAADLLSVISRPSAADAAQEPLADFQVTLVGHFIQHAGVPGLHGTLLRSQRFTVTR